MTVRLHNSLTAGEASMNGTADSVDAAYRSDTKRPLR